MVHGCGNNIVKVVLFAVNILFFALGGIIFGVGLWSLLDQNFDGNIRHLANQTDIPENFIGNLEKYEKALWLLALIGGFLLIVSFFGCYGTVSESTGMISLYFLIVLILAVIKIVAIIFALKNQAGFKMEMAKMVQTAYTSHPEEFAVVQDAMHCCGANGTKSLNPIAPRCPEGTEGLTGCVDAMWAVFDRMEFTFIMIIIIILFVEFVALTFSCILHGEFQKRNGFVVYK